MTTFSRMNFLNLKQRRSLNSQHPQAPNNILRPADNDPTPKLTLPQPTSYEPTNPFSNSRTSMRMLKGKIDKNTTIDRMGGTGMNVNVNGTEENRTNGFLGGGLSTTEMNHTFKPKPEEKKPDNAAWNMETKTGGIGSQNGLKLTLPEEEAPKQTTNDKLNTSKQGFGRRIMIQPAKLTTTVTQPPVPLPSKQLVPEPVTETHIISKQPQPEHPKLQKPPKESPPPTEQIQNENELVDCPEGCGRKFNRKALETHTKACKIVFMSKRKEFNSQAKRISNKQQATLVKQAKQKQKKQQIVASKIQKSGEAWKTQSQGFRAVVKALKQQQLHVGDQQQIKSIKCQFCQKMFNQLLLPKHLLICQSKTKKHPKKATKKY